MPRSRMSPLIIALFAGDVALGIAYWVDELMGRPRPGLSQLIDLNGEANVPAWFSSMQMFWAGVVLAGFALRLGKPKTLSAWALLLLPTALIAMSCDEVAQLHERIGAHTDALLPGGSRANTVFKITGIWMFLLGVPFIVFLAWVLRVARRAFAPAPGSLARVVVGFALFLTGALAVDGLSNAFVRDSRAFNACTLIEEELELLGMTVVCWGSLRLAHHDRRKDAVASETSV